MTRPPAAPMPFVGVRILLPLALLLWAACSEPSNPNAPSQAEIASAPTAWYLIGAGDIAGCSTTGDEATATLLDGIVASRASGDSLTVFTAGDNAYDNGTAAEYTNCYNPTWGHQKARTRPTLGNHEYTVSATPSFDYFNGVGSQDGPAGPRDKGYYSYDLGTWHIVVLNDNIISTSEGSIQSQWLKLDLANTTQQCILAMWHRPRFYSTYSTTSPGLNDEVRPFWVDLYQAGADIVVNGHQHFYERFGPQDPDGNFDNVKGIREFIVGTGGKSNGGTPTNIRANSVVRDGATYGVWKLTLGSGNYTWQFLPVAGKTFTDTPINGTKNCYGPSSPPPPPPNTPPTAAFTPSCTGLSCTFTDQSTDGDGTIASRSWSFGDNTTSTEQSPSHTYAAAGTYSVQLIVTDNGGATGTSSQQVTVQALPPPNAPPTAAFTPSCAGLGCTFTDQSTDGDGTIASRSWSFGDNTTSTEQSPSHTYAAAGTYSVQLIVTDNGGATGTSSQQVTVQALPPPNAPPTAAFTPSCTGLSCTFTNQSTDSDGSLVSWSWDFGDNTTSTAQNPAAHRYQTRGLYTVSLTVTDNGNATGSTTRQVSARIELSASGFKVKGVQHARLTWVGATTAIDIYRGNTKVNTTQNTGTYEDRIGAKGGGSYTYKVCETNTTATATCSNTATVTF